MVAALVPHLRPSSQLSGLESKLKLKSSQLSGSELKLKLIFSQLSDLGLKLKFKVKSSQLSVEVKI